MTAPTGWDVTGYYAAQLLPEQAPPDSAVRVVETGIITPRPQQLGDILTGAFRAVRYAPVTFLGRAHQFPPLARHRLGLRLAAQLERQVAPAPPWGTHPEEFIAAVLFERRRRDQEAFDRRQPRLQAQLAGIESLPFAVPDPES